MNLSITHSEEETQKLAESIKAEIKKHGTVCLFGDLGSGKTTFTKGLASAFGIDKFSIKSPTYTYIRKHSKGKNHIYHIDLYRINNGDDFLLDEINALTSDKNNIIIIEWAEKIENILPKKRLNIYFKYIDANSREIKIKCER